MGVGGQWLWLWNGVWWERVEDVCVMVADVGEGNMAEVCSTLPCNGIGSMSYGRERWESNRQGCIFNMRYGRGTGRYGIGTMKYGRGR